MHRIFAFQLKAPHELTDDLYDYNPEIPNTLKINGGYVKGLYAWTDKKKYKKRFIEERNMDYFISGYIEFESESEYSKFLYDNGSLSLRETEINTFIENGKHLYPAKELLCLTGFEADFCITYSAQDEFLMYMVRKLEDYDFEGIYNLLSIVKAKYIDNGYIEYLYQTTACYDDYSVLFDGYGLYYIEANTLNILKVFMNIHGFLFNDKVYKGDIYETL